MQHFLQHSFWIKDAYQTIIKTSISPFLIEWNNLKPSETETSQKKKLVNSVSPSWIPMDKSCNSAASSLGLTARAGDESLVSCPAATVNSKQGVPCQDLSRAQYRGLWIPLVKSQSCIAIWESYGNWSARWSLKNVVELPDGVWFKWIQPYPVIEQNVHQPCGYFESKSSYPGEPQNMVQWASTHPHTNLFLEVVWFNLPHINLLLEGVSMISYARLDMFDSTLPRCIQSIHSVALQSANFESPTARWR